MRASGDPRAERFLLPPLPRLLPVAYHPKAAQIEFRSNGWVRSYLGDCFATDADLRRYLRQRVGILGPLAAPKSDERRVCDLADFYQFVTVVDDVALDGGAGFDVARDRIRQTLDRVMTGAVAEAGTELRFARAAVDLWRRIAPSLSPRQVGRFGAGVATFLRGLAAEQPFRGSGTAPDYERYLAVRLESFGCDLIALLNEYAMAVDLSELASTPELREVYTHGMRQLILVNDLLSLPHEEGDPMNAVRVLCAHERLAPAESVRRVCQLVERHERAYLAARDAVDDGPLSARADVRAYLDGFDHLIGGAQEFQYLSPRYFGDGFVWDGTTSGWISLGGPRTHGPWAR